MPEHDRLIAALTVHQRRLRIASVAVAILAAAAAASAACVLLTIAGAPALVARYVAVGVLAVIASLLSAWWSQRWTTRRVAAAVELRMTGLDNVIVTAEEVLNSRGGVVHPVVGPTLFHQAADRLQAIAPGSVQPLAAALSLALLAVATAGGVIVAVPQSRAPGVRTAATLTTIAADTIEAGDVRVVVTPPAYTGRGQTASINPSELVVIEGSRIRLETSGAAGRPQLVDSGRNPVAFDRADDRWLYEFNAAQSRVLLIQQRDGVGREAADRLLQLRVDPDRRPLVRIRTPGKDMIFGEPRGQLPVVIEARDDLGLASLVLRYTRVAGSGETFTFAEGTAPVQIQRTSAGDWRGHATLTLDALKLEDGDTLVYRAIATDHKPGADPAASDTFLIEIGRLAGVASTGFAVPEERDRQAISQQMLIIKTERLHRERSTLSREVVEEQSRLLAVEQRMVKAEFVFMTGGEVADEVEEAEHAHELAEGRFENAAQVELLAAIREMSRAEARLNAADTAQALTFERAALRALQRAFDRRRYLLRTLPERTRIDLARRLSGDRSAAQALARPSPDARIDPSVATARQVMLDLSTAIAGRGGLNAALASKVLGVDPTSDVLQKAATTLASEGAIDARVAAAHQAQQHLAAFVRARLPAAAHNQIVHDPLIGRFADQSASARGKR